MEAETDVAPALLLLKVGACSTQVRMKSFFVAGLALSVVVGASSAFAQMPPRQPGPPPYPPRMPVAAPPPYAPRAAPTEESTSGEYRVLGGHRFVTPNNIESAIANTSVAFAQGGGVLNYAGVSAFNGSKRDVQVFLYTQSVLATIGLANRIAFDLRASGAAAVGGDLDTILTVGAIANLNAGGMAKIRIVTLDDVGLQLAAGVGGYYSRSLNLQPIILLGKALGDAKSLETDVIQQTSSFELVPAVMVAEGVGAFGAQLSVAPRIRTATGQSTSVDAGAHLTLDVGKLTPVVPIALSGEYQLSLPTGAGEKDHHIGASVFYSGRQAFNVGVLGGFHLYGSGTQIITGGMAMQYFF